MLTLIRWIIVGLGLAAAAVTVLSLTRSSHWPLRIWDFPRVQIAVVAAASGLAYATLFYPYRTLDSIFLSIVALSVCWQLYKIYPYTRIANPQVQWSHGAESRRTRIRLLISNVQMENGQHAKLLHVIQESDPDLILAVETDQRWERALLPLTASYPHHVRQIQDNYYGMMLFSRFPLIAPRIDFLIQPDIPSVHTGVELPNGVRIRLHGLHPRPPEPLRSQDSTPRDAELVLVGRHIGESNSVPTIVAGDLNDVAWSSTTRLFLRLSGLLDPRVGRGFYNSFDVHNSLCRYPLDHVFHSNHFRLVELRRLRAVGSDHFPMLIELSYEPDAAVTQSEPEAKPEDAAEAETKLEEQAQAARTGADRPGRGESDQG